MAVSEVKFVQVPRALPVTGAPHPAVIALQLLLPLPLFLHLFSSLHQDIEENLLEVFRVLISQPTCILFSPFRPWLDNFDLNFPWKGAEWAVRGEEGWGASVQVLCPRVPSPSTSGSKPFQQL